jgi:hypothetical protein
MKPNRRLLLTLTLLTLFFIFFPGIVHAQIDPAGDPDAPIDGGLGILIAAGVGYGLKKMRDHNRNNKNEIQQ